MLNRSGAEVFQFIGDVGHARFQAKRGGVKTLLTRADPRALYGLAPVPRWPFPRVSELKNDRSRNDMIPDALGAPSGIR